MATTIVLDPEIEARLEDLSRVTGRSKDATIKELIQHGIDELEDTYLGAIEAERVRRGESRTRSLEAVIADLGLVG